MSLGKGTLSYSMYTITDRVNLSDDKIQELRFKPQPNARHKNPVSGWTDHLDPDRPPTDTAYGPWSVLGCRVDQKKIPASAIKMECMRRYREVMQERGVPRLSRNHKQEIRETVEEELLCGALPTTRTFEVAWDTNVIVSSVRPADLDAVSPLLFETIGDARLYRFPDWAPSVDEKTWASVTERLGISSDDLATNDISRQSDVVAESMLRWLWWRTEVDDAVAGECIWTSDRIKFARTGENGTETSSFRGGAPADLPETHTLAGERRIASMRFGATIGDGEYAFTLTVVPTGFQISGVRMPACAKDEDPTFERISLVNRLSRFLTATVTEYVSDVADTEKWTEFQRWQTVPE